MDLRGEIESLTGRCEGKCGSVTSDFLWIVGAERDLRRERGGG